MYLHKMASALAMYHYIIFDVGIGYNTIRNNVDNI